MNMNRHERRKQDSTASVKRLKQENQELRQQLEQHKEQLTIDAIQTELRTRDIEGQAVAQTVELAEKHLQRVLDLQYMPFFTAMNEFTNFFAVIDVIATIPNLSIKKGLLTEGGRLDTRLYDAFQSLKDAIPNIDQVENPLPDITRDVQNRMEGIRLILGSVDSGEYLSAVVKDSGGEYPRMLIEALQEYRTGRPNRPTIWRQWLYDQWVKIETADPKLKRDPNEVGARIISQIEKVPEVNRTQIQKDALKSLENTSDLREYRKNLMRNFEGKTV